MSSVFSAGAIGLDLTAHVARKGFDDYSKLISSSRVDASKGVHTRLAGDFVKDGFERYGRAMRLAQTEGNEFAAGTERNMTMVSDSMKGTADSSVKYMSLTREQIGLTSREFYTVADAANFSAKEQEEAYARMAAAAEESSKAQRAAMEKSSTAKDLGGAGGNGIYSPGGAGGGDDKAPEAHGAKAGKSWSKGFESTANLGKWLTLGAVGVGALSVKVAADFEKQMTLVQTQAGYSEKDIKKLNGEVLKLSTVVGIGPTKLAEGLFHIASSGIPAAKAMGVLRSAAELAKVGNTGMEETTNALVAVMKTAPKDIKNTGEAVAIMNEIVGHGNMRMKDLVGALTTGILPAAKAVGLGFRDVGAALDTMTARGIPAEEASTRLRTSLTLIAHPTAKAEKALMQLGLSHDALAKEFEKHGLIGGLETLQKSMDKTFPPGKSLNIEEQKKAIETYKKSLEEAGVTGLAEGKNLTTFEKKLKETGTSAIQQGQIISEAFGGARTGTTMQILMQNIDDVKKHTEELHKSGATQKFSADFKKSMETMSAQAGKFWADLQVLGVKIGDVLIPVLEKFLKILIETGDWLGKHKTVLDALAVVFGSVMVLAITAFFTRWAVGMAKSIKQMAEFGMSIGKLPGKVGDATSSVVSKLGLQRKEIEANTEATEKLGAAAEESGAKMGRLSSTGEEVTPGGVILPNERNYSGTSGASNVGSKGDVIEGVRGPIGAGSSDNPIVTATEASEYTGLGSRASAKEANQPSLLGSPSTARDEEEAGKEISGKTTAAPAEAEGMVAAETSGGMSKLAGRAMKGAGVFFAGQMAANIGGEMIGGKTGSMVSGIGGDVAAGAGAGMLLGPEGAVAGAAIGGVAGALTKIPGATKAVEGALKSVIAWFEKLWKTSTTLRDVVNGVWAGIEESVKGFVKVLQGLWMIIEGIFTGNWRKIWSGVKEVFIGAWEEMAGKFKIMWALTKGEFEVGVKVVEALWKAFWKLLSSAVSGAAKGIVDAASAIGEGVYDALKFWYVTLPTDIAKWLMKAAESMASLGKEFFNEAWTLAKHVVEGLISGIESAPAAIMKAGEKVGKGILDSIGSVLEIASPSKATKKIGEYIVEGLEMGLKNAAVDKVIERSFTKLAHQALVGFQTDATKTLGSALGEMEKILKGGFHNMTGSFSSFDGSVSKSMGTMDTAVEDGINFVIKETNSAVTALGGKAISITLSNKLGSGKKKATGGIPNPGSGSADDHILLDPHGNPVAAMSGTEGILNTPQMGIVDSALQIANQMGAMPFKGLSDLWGSGMQHYAEGGKLGYPSSVMGRAELLEQLKLPYVRGGHHGERGLIYDPRPGLDCSSSVSYVLGIPPRVSGEFEHFGKAGAGPIDIFSNAGHVFMKIAGGKDTGFFGTSGFGHPAAGGGPAWFTQAPGESYLKGFKLTSVGADFGGGLNMITDPTVEGTKNSPVVEMVKDAISKTGSAAKGYFNKEMSKLDNATGQNLKDVPAVVGNIMELGKKAAAQLKVPWEPNIFKTLMGKESQGGMDLPPTQYGGGLDPAGPMQIISSTFGQYELPGHTNRMNPWDNVLAGFNYIKHRYGTLNALASVTGLLSANYKGYKGGGLLGGIPRFAGGGISIGGKKESGPLGIIKVGLKKRNPQQRIAKQIHPKEKAAANTKTHLPARTGKAIIPHSILTADAKLKDVPAGTESSLNQLDEADKAIAAIDSGYSNQENYFKLVDTTLTTADVATLESLRGQQLELVKREKGLIGQTGESLEEAEVDDEGIEATMRKEAQKLLAEITKIKTKLKKEGERLAKLRHVRAGKLLTLAEKEAKKTDTNRKKREALTKKEAEIRESYRKRIEAMKNWKSPDTTGEVQSIHEKYQPKIAGALTVGSKTSLQNEEKREVEGVQASAKHAREVHAQELRNLTHARAEALAPLSKQKRSLTSEDAKIKETVQGYKQKYAREGWAEAWLSQVEKYKLDNELQKSEEEAKALFGSDTVLKTEGNTGILGEDEKDKKAVAADAEKLKEQEASAVAQEFTDAQDIASLDVTAGIPIPQEILEIFAKAGLVPPSGLAGYQAGAKAGEGTGAAAEAAKTPEETARAAVEDLANMEAAGQQLFSQFGSNTASQAALGNLVGSPLSGGVRYFGAASGGEGGTGAIPGTAPQQTSTSNTFNQNNTYATGPQNPHVHAQTSKLEFETALG